MMYTLLNNIIYITHQPLFEPETSSLPVPPSTPPQKIQEAYGQVCDIKKVLQLWVSRS